LGYLLFSPCYFKIPLSGEKFNKINKKSSRKFPSIPPVEVKSHLI
jgi:hypothetical protein